ncbi:AAEL017478-PA [Aedes aegypti]|uniref:AAEL017478-PA n=1 Tax=Aedes aegypti TaxID=7159 RepID=J9HSF4_AEDAE|nr:AAEL017478-PA [Aedes aegypti]
MVSLTKGFQQLFIHGYGFTRKQVRKKTIRWRCAQFKALRCTARATSVNDLAGQVVSINGEHNHEIIGARRRKGDLQQIMAERRAERSAGAKANVVYVQTNRGMRLSINGYLFTPWKAVNKVGIWQCLQSKETGCSVQANTERTKSGKQARISIQGQHNHPPIRDRRKCEKPSIRTYSRTKSKAQTEQQTASAIDVDLT